MPSTENRLEPNISKTLPANKLVVVAAVGLICLAICFFAAISDLAYFFKLLAFAASVATFFLACLVLYLQAAVADVAPAESLIDEPIANTTFPQFSEDIEQELLALEEAGLFFGNSLRAEDMFRLVLSRVREIVPHDASVLYSIEDEENFTPIQSSLDDQQFIAAAEKAAESGTAKKSLDTHGPEIGRMTDTSEILKQFHSSAAMPLFHDGKIFAVLEIFSKSEIESSRNMELVLEAISDRIGPLINSSLAFDLSLSKAMTDSLTNLPNERALYMVLENQLAESQRYRDVRPLTVLAIDIKDFTEVNEQFGHATGDSILQFVAQTVREQLRKMDFLARLAGDEFIVILPTANGTVAEEIVERITEVFVKNQFELAEGTKFKIWLNVGWATFWKDGETAEQLLRHAHMRKLQTKSSESSKVLWFPKDYVN